MNARRIGLGVAALQLATSLSLYGVFWKPWTWFQVYGAPVVVSAAMFMASVLFMILPVAALVGVWRRLRIGWYALCAYPAIAWIFGTVPLPFASVFYSDDIRLNSIGITIVDVLAVILGIALMTESQDA